MDNRNTEIDLLELFVRIISYFKKYLWLYIGSIVLGVVFAFFIYFTGDKLYKGNVIVATNDVDGVFYSLFEELIYEIQQGNVSKSLNISRDVAENIVSLDINNIIEQNDKKIQKKKTKEYYKIDLILKDSTNFEKVKDGFKYYIENNIYLKSLNEFDKNKREELIKNIDKEIVKFDSIRYENVKSKVFISNGLEFRNGIVYLYETKNQLEKKNKFSNVFEVIKDFNVSSITTIRGLLLKYVFILFLISFIISISLETKGIIKKYSSDNLNPNN